MKLLLEDLLHRDSLFTEIPTLLKPSLLKFLIHWKSGFAENLTLLKFSLYWDSGSICQFVLKWIVVFQNNVAYHLF